VLVVAAAGNQGVLGSSPITRHPWVLPVVAYGRAGRPMAYSNLGGSIGLRGVGAPGEAIEILNPGGGTRTGGGTSAAAAVVTGVLALLASLVPQAGAPALRSALTGGGRRRTVTPPPLDAGAALERLERIYGKAVAA
jgi:subtilisin family serine protease